MADTVAAVDIGTNSVRLLIARADGHGGLVSVDRRMQVTRLGEGVDATGRLAEGAINRTVDVLLAYRAAWEDAGVDRVRITATSAARDARNASDFVDAVVAAVGVTPEVLPGAAEAALAYRGTVSAVQHAGPCLVLDIGGGSTELIRGTSSVTAATSRQLGSVRITEQLLTHDPADPTQVAAAIDRIDEEVAAALVEVAPQPGDLLVGTAGTVTTVAALHLDLPSYQPGRIHRTVMGVEDVRVQADRLLAMTVEQKAGLGPMAPGRADVIAGGALILLRVMVAVAARTGSTDLVVSEADILDGIALSVC